MEVEHAGESKSGDAAVAVAREDFRVALIESHGSRSHVGEVEAAAARFCRALREQGQTPERTLINAKEVIADAIDGDHVAMAERAVLSCIQHYFVD